jgi:hypothetical protein
MNGPPPPLPASVLAEDVEPAKVAYLRSHVVASGPVTGPFRFDLPAAFYRSKLFLVGESHGSAAPHLFDLALFENVAHRTGLRDYIAECDPVQGAAFDAFVRTGDDTGLRRVFDFWSGEGAQWGSRSYEQKIRALRDISLRLHGAPVRVHGLDEVQDWAMAMDWLAAHGVTIDRKAIDGADTQTAKSRLLLASLPAAKSGEDPILSALRTTLAARAAGKGREASIIASYTALATGPLKGKTAYGMWGLAHVLLAPLKTGASFAATVQQSALPAAGQIATIVLVPIDSYALYAAPTGKGFTPMRLDMFNINGPLVKMDGSADLAAAAPAKQVTVYDLGAAGSPYLAAPDFTRVQTSIGQNFDPADPQAPATRFVRYLGVVRGSDWAGSRNNPKPN